MKYIALTIGPIYKTLSNAKKPKELWSGSYFFSYLMKKIIEKFKDRKFITPYIKDNSIFEESSIGLFHDRFIFESKEEDIELLSKVIDTCLQDISDKLHIELKSLKEYLQIHYDEFNLDDNKNPILEIMPYLDTKELFFKVSSDADNSLIKKLRAKDNFLLDNKKIVDDLKQLTYHKYYCIVHADGDNMSEIIADKTNIENISRNLFEYCKVSDKLIADFGGQTIFAGGDDLLFFAPVVGKDGSSIFTLCEKISEDFKSRLKPATLSFGISINYIKYPLYEALENSREQLFKYAKEDKKDNIAFRVTKHSGQSFDTVVYKGDVNIYDKFLAFVENIANTKDDTNFLHSIHHKIDTHKIVLQKIMTEKEKLKNFFDNYFNKEEHEEYREFFSTLIDFMYVSQDLKLVYATLRFMKFVKGDK